MNQCSPDSGLPEASSSNGAADEDEPGRADDTVELEEWVPDYFLE